MTNNTNYYLLESEIKKKQTYDPSIDIFEISIDDIKILPFFKKFHNFITNFITRNYGAHHNITYIIWGGVASNILLQLTGKTNLYYSLHDIELFLAKDGFIHNHGDILEKLNNELKLNNEFLLEIGGLPIIKNKVGMSLNEYQKRRIYLKNGDLCLNDVIMIVDCIKGKVIIETATGTCHALLAGINTIETKDPSEIKHINRISRRIYRTISKAIRYEYVAGLTLSSESRKCINNLLAEYIKKLDEFFINEPSELDEIESTKQWISNEKIISTESGKRWLYLTTLSETAKRLAGLQYLSSLNRTEFLKFLLDEESIITNILEHPLIEIIRKCLDDPDWPSITSVRVDIAERCYSDFSKYQRPGAEKLCALYSLPKLILPVWQRCIDVQTGAYS